MNGLIPIGTVGLGLMGSSIAACILAAGHPVVSLESSADKREEAGARIRQLLEQLYQEQLTDERPESILQRFRITGDIHDLAGHDVVIEAITENITIKKELFQNLENVLSPQAIIGSNTSAIPVSLLQEGMTHPERLFGIHWAEPAHVTRFMEIICGKQTDLQHAQRIYTLAESWGKEPSLIKKDIRGFITNRIMYAMMREAFFLVENGYASMEDVDRSVRNDLGYWITFAGPFRFMDLTGIPAYLTVMEDLFPDLDKSDTAPKLIQNLVTAGGKGVSNAHGFYEYTPETAKIWEERFLEFSYDIRKLAEKYTDKSR